MKSSVEVLNGLARKITIEIPADKVSSTFDKVYRDIQQNATISGFRKGKAPIKVIKSSYASSAHKEVMQNLLAESYGSALSELKLDPVTEPEVQVASQLLEGNSFTFSAEFEIRPSVQLKKYEGLKVDKKKVSITAADVDAVLSNYQKHSADTVSVFEDRAAQNGDIAEIDFQGMLDGVPFDGGTAKNYQLELGSGNFIPGFEEGVVGMKPGAERDLPLMFPESYGEKSLAGKQVVFKVKLHSLKKKVLPELDDAFANKFGGFKTIGEMREDIKIRLTARDTADAMRDTRTQLIQALVDNNPFEVPQKIVELERRALEEDAVENLRRKGMSDADLETYKEKWANDFKTAAESKVRAHFLIMELADKFEMKATHQDIDAKITEIAQQVGVDKAKVMEHYRSSENGMSGIAYQVVEQKVVSRLLDSADVKEV